LIIGEPVGRGAEVALLALLLVLLLEPVHLQPGERERERVSCNAVWTMNRLLASLPVASPRSIPVIALETCTTGTDPEPLKPPDSHAFCRLLSLS
jgi:hypothetical protein